MRNGRITRGILGTALAFLALGTAVSAAPADGEIEIRGTLRCVADGAKKPVDTLCLAVEPAGFPSGAGVVDERGDFRIRVPLRLLDKKVFLRIYRGESELSVFRIQLESKRLSNESAGATFFLGEHDLSDACADLECDLLTAMAVRERVLGAEAVSDESAAAEQAAAEEAMARASKAEDAAAKVSRAPAAPVEPTPSPAQSSTPEVAVIPPTQSSTPEVALVPPTPASPKKTTPKTSKSTPPPVESPRDAPAPHSLLDAPPSRPADALAPSAAAGTSAPAFSGGSPPRGHGWNPLEPSSRARPMEPTDTFAASLAGGAVVAAISGFVAYDASSDPRPLPDDPILGIEEDLFDLQTEKTLNLQPGEWLAYARESSSPALGRTVTSWNDPEETALWNPSALVSDRTGGLAFVFGSPTEMRMSARMRVPSHMTERAAWMPRVVTLGFVQYREDRDVRLTLESGPLLKAGVTHEETLGLLGLGFALGRNVSAGLSVHTYLQRLDAVDGALRTVRTYADGTRTYRFTTREPVTHWVRADEGDVDLSLTWDVSPSHRIAVVGMNLGGSEAIRGDGTAVLLREAILGYSWRRDRWRAGTEVTSSDDGASVAAGVNWRFRKGLALDVAGGSRFGTVQGGLDVYIWKVESKCRFRYDETEATAASVNFGVRI